MDKSAYIQSFLVSEIKRLGGAFLDIGTPGASQLLVQPNAVIQVDKDSLVTLSSDTISDFQQEIRRKLPGKLSMLELQNKLQELGYGSDKIDETTILARSRNSATIDCSKDLLAFDSEDIGLKFCLQSLLGAALENWILVDALFDLKRETKDICRQWSRPSAYALLLLNALPNLAVLVFASIWLFNHFALQADWGLNLTVMGAAIAFFFIFPFDNIQRSSVDYVQYNLITHAWKVSEKLLLLSVDIHDRASIRQCAIDLKAVSLDCVSTLESSVGRVSGSALPNFSASVALVPTDGVRPPPVLTGENPDGPNNKAKPRS